MSTIFKKYTGLYSVNKTLRFSLIPMFETADSIERYGILNNDKHRADEYKKVKRLFDRCHKYYIEKKLNSIGILNWFDLYSSLIRTQQDKTDDFIILSEKYLKEISRHLMCDDSYKLFKSDAIIKSVVRGEHTFCEFSPEEKESIKIFNRFASYFNSYDKTRENIYGILENSIPYRLIKENFPAHVSNIKLSEQLDDSIICELEEKMAPLLNGFKFREVFSPQFYGTVLNQNGIDFYNALIGGRQIDDSSSIQGLNIYLYNKYRRGELKSNIRFTPLYKLILSDKTADLYTADAFTCDREVIGSVLSFGMGLNKIVDENINELKEVFDSQVIEEDKIYIDKKQLSELSIRIYGKWNIIGRKLKEKGVKGNRLFSLSVLNKTLQKDILVEILDIMLASLTAMKNDFFAIQPLSEKGKISTYDDIKTYLDSVQECERILKIFSAPNEADKDPLFYSVFDLVYGAFRGNIPLYNKVRNYATKKTYSVEKYKLSFGSPILANGWDQNKEYKSNTMIFIKDGKYYLGVLNAKNKTKIKETDFETANCYKKMVYKLLPGPNKMLPKVFFSNKGIEAFGLNEYILEGYKAGRHLKSDNFDIKFCHELIDYFKECIAKHEEWSKFNFKFSDTNSYEDISAFYNEVAEQSYKISFSYVEEKQLRQLVNDGSLFLFQIYNKDFSDYSKGRPNLHTLYWKELFSAENLQKPIFKLNGEAELFYRPASVENPFVHKQGSILVNKNDKYNNPVPDIIYRIIDDAVSKGIDISELEKKYPDYIFKLSTWDIVKDKRFNKANYSFHVPITINYGKSISTGELNRRVLADVSWMPDVNIMGIARGERNLIYVSVINQKGKILTQKSFNIINNGTGTVDYHKKLDTLEKQRDAERKNWKSIESIKKLKEGYISIVIKEIADMVIKYNAIIALEDLNLDFKASRAHIEKAIYQKFEKMLIDKLNYLADKNFKTEENGSIRYGYQLTTKFDSFKKLGKQCGFIFYVPAAYTTNIDPATGFVNLFTPQQLNYQNISKSQEFIQNFREISYDKVLNCFRFDFDYRDFGICKKDYTNCWTVYSYGKNRIMYIKENGFNKAEKIDATEKLKDLFIEYNIDYTYGNLIEKISGVSGKDFYVKFLQLFKVIVQLRYSDNIDSFIISPVQKDGRFFDSRFSRADEPHDADANGAYHIALQGLRTIKTKIKNGKLISDAHGKQACNWFEFVQRKDYLL